jgi:hypothetical protein
MTFFNLENPETYTESCLRLARSFLADFDTPAQVALAAERLNAYPNLDVLQAPKSVRILEDSEGLSELGRRAVLEGHIFWEHPIAGEATRLGLGRKFFLTPAVLARQGASLGCLPVGAYVNLLPINLGFRHLLELLLEIKNLAEQSGLDPKVVLSRQKMLIISTGDDTVDLERLIVKTLSSILPQENLLFMVQSVFHGLNRIPGGDWFFDPASPRRLHNHGQMVMQKTMDRQIYYLDLSGQRVFLDRSSFFSLLNDFEDLISYNIEDLDFLNRALDVEALGLAVRLGRSGYGMIMEITPNNPDRPIKGGMCACDPVLGRDVVVESFRLGEMPPRDIKFINKNFNHYFRPARVLELLREKGLFMPVLVDDDRVYFQPVQGDLNFLTKTAFFARRRAQPLNSLKSSVDIPAALAAMGTQDGRSGFRQIVEKVGLI